MEMMKLQDDDDLFVGYHFIPTDFEMLKILRSKVEGKYMVSPVIERNIYGEGDQGTPWKVFTENDPWFIDFVATKPNKENKILYVITKLIKVSDKKTNRVAGCGCWSGQTKKTYIYDGQQNIIGFRRMFNFKIKENAIKEYGSWIMHEYQLDGRWAEGVSNDYVICKIKRSTDPNTRLESADHIPFIDGGYGVVDRAPVNFDRVVEGVPVMGIIWSSDESPNMKPNNIEEHIERNFEENQNIISSEETTNTNTKKRVHPDSWSDEENLLHERKHMKNATEEEEEEKEREWSQEDFMQMFSYDEEEEEEKEKEKEREWREEDFDLLNN